MPNYNTTYDGRTVHLRLKVNGSVEKRAFLHYVATKLDSDWPFPLEGIGKHGADAAEHCTACGGWEYRAPSMPAEAIRSLAKQVNACKEVPGHVKLKVKRYERAGVCTTVSSTPVIPIYPAGYGDGGWTD